jgi:hypothetical protein
MSFSFIFLSFWQSGSGNELCDGWPAKVSPLKIVKVVMKQEMKEMQDELERTLIEV